MEGALKPKTGETGGPAGPARTRPVLLLDVMGTLVRDPFYEDIPAFFGVGLRDLVRELHPTAWVDFEHGRIDHPTFLSRFFADGRPYDQDAFCACVTAGYEFLDGVESLLADLAAAGIERHTLSNYPVWYEWIEEKLELSRYLDWTFVSCRTGLRKPAPEAYLRAAHDLGRRPEECIFVDDRETNCRAAAETGMDAIRFQGSEALRAALADRGLL